MRRLSARILSGFTALLPTLSRRIIVGFTLLTLTFAGVTTNNVVNQQRLESWLELVNGGYLPLSQHSRELSRACEDLKTYLAESFEKEQSLENARFKLSGLRERRQAKLAATKKFFSDLDIAFDREHLHRDAVDRIEMLVDSQKTHYEHLDVLLQHGETLQSQAVNAALAPLRDGEREIATQSMELYRRIAGRVDSTLKDLQSQQRLASFYTILLGSIAVLLGLLVTAWVVLTLRPLRRLRDATRRVAAGEYGNRIEENGPAEVVELAREFNSMARAVEERERELVRSERLAAVGKMAAMITHEVRNPLSSIGLNTELLQDELESSSDEAKKLLRAIHREVDRLTAITEEYLAFARLPKPKLAPEAINPMVGALAQFMREDLAAKNVKLVTELGDGDPIALVDAAQLRQCLINLVRNATEALAGKPSGTVILRTCRAGDRIVIEVEDNGIGIAADVLPRMFDPFFSTKEGGSGLGLALTQQIVKDHGGDLAVQSTLGRGTTFTVSVPAKPA